MVIGVLLIIAALGLTIYNIWDGNRAGRESKEIADKLNFCTNKAKEAGNQDFLDFCARKLYEMTAYTIMCHLLLQDTQRAPELFSKSLVVFMNYAESEVAKHFNYIHKLDADQLASYVQE